MNHPTKPPLSSLMNTYSVIAIVAAGLVAIVLLANYFFWLSSLRKPMDQCGDIRYESVQAVPQANAIFAFDKSGSLCSYIHKDARWVRVPYVEPPVAPVVTPSVPMTTSTQP